MNRTQPVYSVTAMLSPRAGYRSQSYKREHGQRQDSDVRSYKWHVIRYYVRFTHLITECMSVSFKKMIQFLVKNLFSRLFFKEKGAKTRITGERSD